MPQFKVPTLYTRTILFISSAFLPHPQPSQAKKNFGWHRVMGLGLSWSIKVCQYFAGSSSNFTVILQKTCVDMLESSMCKNIWIEKAAVRRAEYFPFENRNTFKTFYSPPFKIQSLAAARATLTEERQPRCAWGGVNWLTVSFLFVLLRNGISQEIRRRVFVSILTRTVNPILLLTTVLDLCSRLIKNTQSVVGLNSSQLVLLHSKVFGAERSHLRFLSEQVWHIMLLAKAKSPPSAEVSLLSLPSWSLTFLFSTWKPFSCFKSRILEAILRN